MFKTTSAKQEVDKQLLYGKFQAAEDRKANLRTKAAHKALDIAMEEDPLRVTVNKSGLNTTGVMGTAGILAAAALGYSYLNRSQPTTPTPVSPPAIQQPVAPSAAAADLEIRFWTEDEDGNLIQVPVEHISKRKSKE